MDFGEALAVLRAGGKVTREGWNVVGQRIALRVPDENSKMSKSYVYISPVDGELVPWLASLTDMLATDWKQVTP